MVQLVCGRPLNRRDVHGRRLVWTQLRRAADWARGKEAKGKAAERRT